MSAYRFGACTGLRVGFLLVFGGMISLSCGDDEGGGLGGLDAEGLAVTTADAICRKASECGVIVAEIKAGSQTLSRRSWSVGGALGRRNDQTGRAPNDPADPANPVTTTVAREEVQYENCFAERKAEILADLAKVVPLAPAERAQLADCVAGYRKLTCLDPTAVETALRAEQSVSTPRPPACEYLGQMISDRPGDPQGGGERTTGATP